MAINGNQGQALWGMISMVTRAGGGGRGAHLLLSHTRLRSSTLFFMFVRMQICHFPPDTLTLHEGLPSLNQRTCSDGPFVVRNLSITLGTGEESPGQPISFSGPQDSFPSFLGNNLYCLILAMRVKVGIRKKRLLALEPLWTLWI